LPLIIVAKCLRCFTELTGYPLLHIGWFFLIFVLA